MSSKSIRQQKRRNKKQSKQWLTKFTRSVFFRLKIIRRRLSAASESKTGRFLFKLAQLGFFIIRVIDFFSKE